MFRPRRKETMLRTLLAILKYFSSYFYNLIDSIIKRTIIILKKDINFWLTATPRSIITGLRDHDKDKISYLEVDLFIFPFLWAFIIFDLLQLKNRD